MQLTDPTHEGHFRPKSSFLTEIEQYREEAKRGPRKDLLTRFRLFVIDLPRRIENIRRR